MAKQAKNVAPRELGGIILLSASILLAFSLISYDPRDLSFNQSPPNDPRSNYIGPFGAYTAFGLYWLIGWSANLLPLAALFLALSAFFRRNFRLQAGVIWMLIFVLSVSCLTEVLWEGATGWRRKVNNMHGMGGFWGYSIGGKILFQAAVGRLGAFIIFFFAAMAGLFMSLQARPREVVEWASDLWQKWKTEKRREALRRGDLKTVLRTRDEEIAERQKEIAERQRVIEREMDRQARGAQSSPPSETSPNQAAPVIRKTKPAAEIAKLELPGFASAPGAPAKEGPAPSSSFAGAPAAGKEEKPEYKIIRTIKVKPAPRARPQPVFSGPYRLPGSDLLQHSSPAELFMDTKEQIANKAAVIERTLKDFEIEVRMGEITQGATVTRYEVIPSPGVKVERIVNLQNNLSLALKAERVNILAPVAGKGTVGIEVANLSKAIVLIRELIESQEFQSSKAKIPLALGKDVYGKTLIADLADMPHLLIAGSTGSGKSVCINSILASITFKFSPDDMRLILIDPKVVELQMYNALPHLVVPVVSDPKKVIVALRWVIREMEKRYKIMAKVGVRSITAFNSRSKTPKRDSLSGTETLADLKKAVEDSNDTAQPLLIPEDEVIVPEKMPYIIVFVDELADLMITAPVDAEDAVTRITQMARAAGIHLVVATQTPRAEVVTGTIKTNLPSKISFRVASKVDSRVILDENGAENLLGKGDMIYKSSDSSTLRRAQGAFISDEEVCAIVNFCAQQVSAQYDAEIQEKLSKPMAFSSDPGGEDEELIEQCIQVIRQEGRASTSLLQRRLRLGYTRAARIMDVLEERGLVGPSQGAKDREILMRLDGSPAEK